MNTPPIDTTGHTAALTGRTGRTGRQEQRETGPKLTQPTADKSPVRIDTAASPKGRTLDERHPRRIAGTSSPSIRHHEGKRQVTADEVREPFEAATRKIEAEAIDTLDAFTDAFVGGLQEAENDVRRIHGSLSRLEQTIERNFGGIRQDLRAQREQMDALGKRFNTGLQEGRTTRQRIVESMQQENADYKNMVASMERTIQLGTENNERHAKKNTELQVRMEARRAQRNPNVAQTSAPDKSAQADASKRPRNPQSAVDKLAAIRARHEARKREAEKKS